jgi:hypothetical protein
MSARLSNPLPGSFGDDDFTSGPFGIVGKKRDGDVGIASRFQVRCHQRDLHSSEQCRALKLK